MPSLLLLTACLTAAEIDDRVEAPLHQLESQDTTELGDTAVDTTDDGGSGDGSGGGGSGGGDGTDVVPLVPTYITGVLWGQYDDGDWQDVTWPVSGDVIQPRFAIVLYDDEYAWSGDMDHACIVYVEPNTDVPLTSLYQAEGAWEGWRLDVKADFVRDDGNCEGLGWGDVAAELDTWGWSYGFGPVNDDLLHWAELLYGGSWQDVKSSVVSLYFGISGADIEPAPMNFAFALEGTDDGFVGVDVTGATALPTAYYEANYLVYNYTFE